MRFAMLVALAAISCAPAAAPVAPPPPPCPRAAPIAPPPAPAPVASASAKTAPSAAPSPPPPAPAPLPKALTAVLGAAQRAIAARHFAAADRQLAAASKRAGDNAHFRFLVAEVRATRFVYAGDFDRAGAALLDVIPTLAKHPELPDEFWAHNAMMMIREAQGDPAVALAENDQATLCAARGTWEPGHRKTLAFQKDRWHRAYLTRMLAESRTGSTKRALVHYAEAALDDYRTRGFADSVAVLDAYFAALDGKRAAALAAAKSVDPAKDHDVEDLYLVVVGLEAGGDHAAAEAVKRVMRGSGSVNLARAIMLRWLDMDAKPQPRGFTPWHARRP